MRAWSLRLITADGRAVGVALAVKRFFLAIPSLALAGIGLWMSLFNRDGLAWHDRQTKTRIVLLPKGA